MKKKILYFIMIFAAIAAMFALASCGKKDSETTSETTDIVAELPYINDFKCAYYDVNGEKIEDKSAVLTSDELWVKTNFTLLPDAYAEGKGRFTLKFILSADFVGKIVSANSSATSDKDFTATFTADDKKSKNCEIELRIKINYSTGSFKIVYAYDDEVYTEACELPLNNNKTLLYTYDEATDGYIVSRDSNGSRWLADTEEVYLPDLYDGKPVTSIGQVFFNCKELKSVTIPNGVKEIGEFAFFGCGGLKSVTIPNSVTSIGGGAFEGCPIETATIPNFAISRIPKEKLKTVTITSGYSIDREALKDCVSLKSISISDGVKSIEDYAFSGCCSLMSIIIPDSVTSIGEGAFV